MTTTAVNPRDRRWVSARRAAATALHPDRGGDPQTFITALADIDATYGHGHPAAGGSHDAPVIVIVGHRRWRRLIAAISRAVHHVPGTRRHYIYL